MTLPHSLWIRFSQYLPLALIICIALLFLPSLAPLAAHWIIWDQGMSHGWLVMGVYAFLLWRSLPWPPVGGTSAFWLLGLAGLSCCWFVLQIAHIEVATQLLVLLISLVSLASLYSWARVRRHLAILLLPLFATSIWGDLSPYLVDLSGLVVGSWIKGIGIPAHIDGNSIFLPYGHIVIADGCSGLRYLVVGLAIGAMQGCFSYYPARLFSATLLVAGLLGLFANWLRIFIIVLVGYFTQMQSPLMHDHDTFGWLLFGALVLLPLCFAPRGGQGQAPSFAQAPRLRQLLWVLGSAASGPLLYLLIDSTPHPQPLNNRLDPRLSPLPLTSLPMAVVLSQEGRREQGFDAQRQVYWQINQYQRSVASDKLVPFIGAAYDDERWLLEANLSGGLVLSRDKLTQRQLVRWRRFVVGHQSFASFAMAKLWQLPALVWGETDFALVTLEAECAVDCTVAAQRLLASAQEFGYGN